MRFILATIVFLTFYPFDSLNQEQEPNSPGFQVGLKSSVLLQTGIPRFSAEVQYLTNGNRWIVGYQYFSFSTWVNRHRPLYGFYGEGEFIDWEFGNKWRVALPLRLYFIPDPYWEGSQRFPERGLFGLLSVGADLHYKISPHWEAGLTLGYIGYGRNLAETGYQTGLLDGTGLSIYYRF